MNHQGQLSRPSLPNSSSEKANNTEAAHAANVAKSFWTPERVDDLRRLNAERRSASLIATHFGEPCTRNMVCGKLHRLGLSRPMEVRSAEQARMMKERRLLERARRDTASSPVLRLVKNGNGMAVIKSKTRGPLHIIEAMVESRHVSFMDLERKDCRYPYGDGPVTFCGHPKREDSSYCPAHHQLCWSPRVKK